MEGETRLLPYMKKPMSHEELVRSHLDHKASLKSSKSLYLRYVGSDTNFEIDSASLLGV